MTPIFSPAQSHFLLTLARFYQRLVSYEELNPRASPETLKTTDKILVEQIAHCVKKHIPRGEELIINVPMYGYLLDLSSIIGDVE